MVGTDCRQAFSGHANRGCEGGAWNEPNEPTVSATGPRGMASEAVGLTEPHHSAKPLRTAR